MQGAIQRSDFKEFATIYVRNSHEVGCNWAKLTRYIIAGGLEGASLEDFHFYYSEHAAEYDRDDDEFGVLMSKLWNFSFIPSYSLDRVAKLIRQAIETGHGEGIRFDQIIKESFARYDKNHE